MGQLLGARDTVVGATLLGMSGPLPMGLRLASDLHDAIRLRHRSPMAAVGAAAVSVWGAAVLAVLLRGTARSSPRRSRPA